MSYLTCYRLLSWTRCAQRRPDRPLWSDTGLGLISACWLGIPRPSLGHGSFGFEDIGLPLSQALGRSSSVSHPGGRLHLCLFGVSWGRWQIGQFPLHVWLPGRPSGWGPRPRISRPDPYGHDLVAAGVFLVGRAYQPIYIQFEEGAGPFIAVIRHGSPCFLGATRIALTQMGSDEGPWPTARCPS